MYSDNRRNLGGSVSCQSNHLAHLYNNTMRKSGVIVEGLFLTFAQQIFHSEAISYCFAIALFDPLLNKKTETICLRNDFCFSGGDEEDRPTCCRNGRHAPGHRNSPPDCFYCFAIALFDPLLNKKTETICLRNDFCFFWWRRRGSNSRPYGCEPYALPAELRPRVFDTNNYILSLCFCQDFFF